jgi:glycosyltransferase involved in cell wall biosynthesis/peptidoglycan/xylan/chitin deacetylase (PgdA/CDA1 family)
MPEIRENIIQEKIVSVIIPCFNAEKYIGQAIESILNQTYKNFELLIINDGSSDSSPDVIKKYGQLDKRVNYFEQVNNGVSYSRNRGIELAKGEIIAFLDADDVWEPENLEVKTNALKEDTTIDWVFSDVYLADEHLTKTEVIEGGNDTDILNSLLSRKGDVIHAPSNIVVRSKCLGASMVLFDKKLSTSADWDFCVQLAAKKFKGKRIPLPLWSYRVLENSMSRNLQVIERDNLYVHQKAKEQKLFKSTFFKLHCFSNNYLILAGCWWVNGNNKTRGAYYIFKSILFYPPNILKLLIKLRAFNLYQAKRIPIEISDNFIKRNLMAKQSKVPIRKNITTFLFHRINTIQDPLWNPIHPEHFEQIIVYLKRNFELVSLKEYLLEEFIPQTRKPLCAIGFDDGYRDFIEFALPILKKYNCPSSMYVVTDCIDNDLPPWTYMLNHYFINTAKLKISIDTTDFPGHLKNTEWRSKADRLEYARQLNPFMKSLDNSKRCYIYEEIVKEFNDVTLPHGLMLTWDEIRDLKNYKCEVGSHTVSHPVLSKNLSNNELIHELKESALIIEKHTGVFPATISYPFGAYNQDVKKAAFDAGYKIGVTVNPAPYDSKKHNMLEIPRIELFDEPFIKTKLRINEIIPRIREIITFRG